MTRVAACATRRFTTMAGRSSSAIAKAAPSNTTSTKSIPTPAACGSSPTAPTTTSSPPTSPVQALGELLAYTGRHPSPLRCPRPEDPPHFQQQRARQHSLAAAGWPHPLYALGIRRSQPGPLSPSLGRQPRRHGPDDLVWQPPPRH